MQRYCFFCLHSIKWYDSSVEGKMVCWTGNMRGWIGNVQVLLPAWVVRSRRTSYWYGDRMNTGWIILSMTTSISLVWNIFYNFSWFHLFFRNIFFNFACESDGCSAWKCQHSLICPQHTPSLFVGVSPYSKGGGAGERTTYERRLLGALFLTYRNSRKVSKI